MFLGFSWYFIPNLRADLTGTVLVFLTRVFLNL